MSGTRKLKTPTETIERKDLSVAMRLFGIANREDTLFDVVALVQSVSDNESIYRVSEIKSEKVELVGRNVRVHGTDAAGLCTDFTEDANRYDVYNIVIAGKLVALSEGDYLIVADEETEPLGEDTLRVVR